MQMKFSQRKGLVPAPELQRDRVSDELRAGIWNTLRATYWSDQFLPPHYLDMRLDDDHIDSYAISQFSHSLWRDHLKRAIDERPIYARQVFSEMKKYFFDCEWFEFYELLEFIVAYYRKEFREADDLIEWINDKLAEELSAYRIVGGIVCDVTDQEEIEMLEQALTDEDFPTVRSHLKRALELLSDRKKPDYRNSIKESISAVESMARHIANKRKASLGDALKVIEKKHKLHSALKEGFL